MKKRFRVHPASLALLAGAFLFAPSSQVLASLLALACHEAAHLIAMRICGVPVCYMELTPFGGMADAAQFEQLSPLNQAICAAAGVAASFIGAWFFRDAQDGFYMAFFQSQISLAVVNALPLWPLDGARVCMAFAIRLGCERAARRLLSVLAQAAGALLVVLGLYGAWHGYVNLSLLTAGPYLCYAARMGMVSERLRKLQYAANRNVSFKAIQAFVTDEKQISYLLPGIVSRFTSERYHLLIQLNETKRGIEKIWTEHEMVRMLFAQSDIPSTANVDKRTAL